MRILGEPELDLSVEELFEKCANSFRDEKLKTRLLSYSERIKRHSLENKNRVPSDIKAFLEIVQPEQVPKEDMIKVYEEKLRAGIGRRYYEKLRNRAGGKCAICGINKATSLDHYLPKSVVPTLAVDPGNLIPACQSCNEIKKDRFSDNSDELPVHMYLDKIPEGKWLHVRLKAALTADYYIECPEEWDVGLRTRMERHLHFYELHEMYSDEAADALTDLMATWKIEREDMELDEAADLSAEDLKKEFVKIVRKQRRKAETIDLNSCEAAYFRGLEAHMDEVWATFGIEEPVGAK